MSKEGFHDYGEDATANASTCEHTGERQPEPSFEPMRRQHVSHVEQDPARDL